MLKFMNKLKIKTRLIISFGIIIFNLLIFAVFSAISINIMDDSFDNFHNIAYKNMIAQLEIRKNMNESSKYILQAIASNNKKETESAIAKAQNSANKIKANIYYLNTNSNATEIKQDMNNRMDVLIIEREKVIDLAQRNYNNEAKKIYNGDYSVAYDNMVSTMLAIGNYEEENAILLSNRTDNIRNIVIILNITMAFLSVIISVYLATLITKSIAVPMGEMVVIADNITKGNFDNSFKKTDLNGKGEIAQLANKFNEMAQNLDIIINDIKYMLGEMANGNFVIDTTCKEKYIGEYDGIFIAIKNIKQTLNSTLNSINVSFEGVNMSSEQVSTGAQALSQGTAEQASSIQELSAAISEISEKINKNSNNANCANDLSIDAGNQVAASNKKMHNLTVAMQDISCKSNEIRKIIKTIEDIAFQTNILALNAAVEAARAGTAGKGFAVVADEVRNLAQKSSEAAKNTNDLIVGTVKAIKSGVDITDETANALNVVVEKSNKLSKMLIEITNDSNEQVNGIMKISTGIDQISSVVQTNSASAEESAATAEELSSQSNMLKNLAAQFKLDTVINDNINENIEENIDNDTVTEK